MFFWFGDHFGSNAKKNIDLTEVLANTAGLRVFLANTAGLRVFLANTAGMRVFLVNTASLRVFYYFLTFFNTISAHWPDLK